MIDFDKHYIPLPRMAFCVIFAVFGASTTSIRRRKKQFLTFCCIATRHRKFAVRRVRCVICRRNFEAAPNKSKLTVVLLIFQGTCWLIWKERNARKRDLNWVVLA